MTTITLEKWKQLFDAEKTSVFEDYFTFLRFPTVSADPKRGEDLEKCAEWLRAYLETSGLEAELWKSKGASVVFAQSAPFDPSKKTVLLYCHYDVQPEDPVEAWISPPFQPTVRNNAVYARGASDNKGQCFYTIAALKILLRELKSLPVNIKFVIEGEEESGSVALAELLPKKRNALKADYLLIVDSGIEQKGHGAITLGARGITTMEITLQEGNSDLHSGMVGGLAYNPNRALVELLASLRDKEGKVTIPGFYDDVVPPSAEECKQLDLDLDRKHFVSLFGFEPQGSRDDVWLRPTLEINGIYGGYAGEGFKTVIPAKAVAKLSCRLVPNQDPKKIAQLVRTHIEKIVPKGMQVAVKIFAGGGKGFRTPATSPLVEIMSESYEKVFPTPCKKILCGGSIPIAVELADAAEAQMLLIGVSLPGDQIHAPNEHFGLDQFEQGFLIIANTISSFK